MHIWTPLVELAAQGLLALSTILGGNLGPAILLVSLTVRLSLLPMGLKLARAARAQAKLLEAMKPEQAELERRFKNDPARLWQETAALRKRHGVVLMSPTGLLTLLIQMPVFALLSGAIRTGVTAGSRFLWIKDLARPDTALVLGIALLSAAVAGVGHTGAPNARLTFAVISALLSLFFVWKLSAGLGLYWAASSGVGLLQAVLVRPRSRR